MAVVLNATPSSASANAYLLVAAADAYVESYVLDEATRLAWAALSDDDKARLIIQATRQIDWYFEFKGQKTVFDQALQWPRMHVWRDRLDYVDYTTIPNEVIHATMEQLLFLMENGDETPAGDQAQFDEIAVGPIKIAYNENASLPARVYVCDKAVSILKDFGCAHNPDIPAANRGYSVRVDRG